MLNNVEDLLVRHEHFGLLLYSRTLKNYYIPKNKEIEKVIENALNTKRQGGNWKENITPDLKEELFILGFGGDIRELYSELENRLMAPLEIYFDYTYKCNLRCTHCYNKDKLCNVTMPPQKVSSSIKEIYDMGIMRIHLAGGEPTIDPKGLLNYLNTAKEYGLITSMSSNGTLLTDDLCEKLIDLNLFAFTISVDGPDAVSNDSIRGNGNFIKAIEGIKKILSYRNEKKSKTKICIKSVCSTKTPHELIEGIVKLGLSLKVDEIKFYSPERSLHHDLGYYGKNVDKYYEMIKFMEMLKRQYTNKIKVSPVINPVIGCLPIGLSNIKGCIGANELLTINPDGNITPCLMMHESLGNTYETTLKDFWNKSEKLKRYNECVKSKECESCNIYKYCRGGCQVRKFVEFSEIKNKDPLCPKDHIENFEPVVLDARHDLKHFNVICVTHSL